MREHTDGPWVTGSDDESPAVSIYARTEDDGPLIADVLLQDVSHEACRANARLIAAAPDLLAALMEMMEMMGIQDITDDCWCDNSVRPCEACAARAARAAIAKATGEES